MTSTQSQQRAELVNAIQRSATFEGQLAAVAALDEFDATRREAARTAASIDLANTAVEERLMPVRVHEHHTASTDWLGQAEASAGYGGHEIVAEAALWYDRTSPELRADAEEFGHQAEGFIRRQASQYGEQASALYQEGLAYLGFRWRREAASGLDQIQQTVDPNNSPKTTPLNPETFDNFAPEVDPINAGVVGTETSERAPLLQEIEQEGAGQAAPEKPGGHSTADDFSGGYSEVPVATPEQMAAQGARANDPGHEDCPNHPGQSYSTSTGACSCGSNHRTWASSTNPGGQKSSALFDERTVALGGYHGTLDDFRREGASTLEQVQEVVDANNQAHPENPLPTDVMFPWLISPNQSNGDGQKAAAAKDSDTNHNEPTQCPACGRRQGWDGHPYAKCDGSGFRVASSLGDGGDDPFSSAPEGAARQTVTAAADEDAGLSHEDLVADEHASFKRRPDWELDATHKALNMMPFLNGPREDARLDAIKQIRKERRQKRRAQGSLQATAAMTFHEQYGPVSNAQLAAYRKHNVSPSDHDYLEDQYGPSEQSHAAITKAVKDPANHQGSSFSTYLHQQNADDARYASLRTEAGQAMRKANQAFLERSRELGPHYNAFKVDAFAQDPDFPVSERAHYDLGYGHALNGEEQRGQGASNDHEHRAYTIGHADGREAVDTASRLRHQELPTGEELGLSHRGSTTADMYGNSDMPHAVMQPNVANTPETTPLPNAGRDQGFNDGMAGNQPLFADGTGHAEYTQGYTEGVEQAKSAIPKSVPRSMGGDNERLGARYPYPEGPEQTCPNCGTTQWATNKNCAACGWKPGDKVGKGDGSKAGAKAKVCTGCGESPSSIESTTCQGGQPHDFVEADSKGQPKFAGLKTSSLFVRDDAEANPDFAKGYAFASKWNGGPIVAKGSAAFEQGLFAGITDNPAAQRDWVAKHGSMAQRFPELAQRIVTHASYTDRLVDSGVLVKNAATSTDLDTVGPHTSPDPGGQTPINGPGTVPPLAGQADPARGDGPAPYNGAEPYGHPVVPTTPTPTPGPHTVNDVLGGPVDGNARATAAFRKRVQSNLLRSLNGQELIQAQASSRDGDTLGCEKSDEPGHKPHGFITWDGAHVKCPGNKEKG